MATCSQTNIPEISTTPDPCGGERIETGCVITDTDFDDLDIDDGDTQTQVNQALYNAFVTLTQEVNLLNEEINLLKGRVTILETP
jgi:hypothetical protein